MASVLHMTDPKVQLVVDEDASDVSIGAFLSQQGGKDQLLHPCIYLSHRLTPPERNYDVRDRELLAVRLALQGWRHWFEWA